MARRMLVLCPYPIVVPAIHRLKFEQYYDDWPAAGSEVDVDRFMDPAGWSRAVEPGHLTPTYTLDFARNVDLLLDTGLWGVYNMVCTGVTSRLDVAVYLLQSLGMSGDVRITPVSSDHFAKEYSSPRPSSERLLTIKRDLRGLNLMRTRVVSLAGVKGTLAQREC
jgi:hypothetical protein